MNRIDLTQLGGFPFEQDTLKFMQDNVAGAFSGIAKLCGSKTILSGVVLAGGNVSDGWISYNGELIQFVGGVAGAQVVITESPAVDQALFEDASLKDVYFAKTATCGAVGDFPFSDLVPLLSLQNMWRPGDIKEKYCDAAFMAANYDVDGYGVNAEKGWRILSKAYPDTAGKVMVNLDPADVDFDTVGKNGGEKAHILTIPEMPAHTHTQIGVNAANSGTSGTGANNGVSNTGSTGGGAAHNNMQPYFVILKLIKL
jgi:hypothetical protein